MTQRDLNDYKWCSSSNNTCFCDFILTVYTPLCPGWRATVHTVDLLQQLTSKDITARVMVMSDTENNNQSMSREKQTFCVDYLYFFLLNSAPITTRFVSVIHFQPPNMRKIQHRLKKYRNHPLKEIDRQHTALLYYLSTAIKSTTY